MRVPAETRRGRLGRWLERRRLRRQLERWTRESWTSIAAMKPLRFRLRDENKEAAK